MFHCFAGNIDYLKKALDLGFYVGFDGNITYKGLAPGEETELKDLVSYAPIEKIVTETDSPFLTPIPYRGGRNEPSYVIIVAETIAKIKGISFELVDKIITQNSKKIFKI
jgi:TatD DNase family protein